jgi:uncharacterized membrane protein YdfJ with MMPL/SSD domain
LRSLFDALDGIDQLTDQLANVSGSIAKLNELQPKLLALIRPQIENQQTNHDLTMTNYATTSGIYDQTAAALQNSTALGQAYDASKTDDSFYLPPEAFSNPEFLRGLKLFLSPDGKAARMIITHDVDPATPEGISHIDAIRHAAQEAVKGTSLAGSKIYIGGMASTYKDIADMAHYDLIIAGINTGINRSMAGSGSVVTAAGLVFAFTMASFIFSDLRVLGQIGTTIALGLMFDTLIVRSFMTRSIAALLGRWFWWPVRVRQRPAPQEFGDEDTRQLSLF